MRVWREVQEANCAILGASPREEDTVASTANKWQCNRAGRVAVPGKREAGNFRAAPLKEYWPEPCKLIVGAFEDAWPNRVPVGVHEELSKCYVELD